MCSPRFHTKNEKFKSIIVYYGKTFNVASNQKLNYFIFIFSEYKRISEFNFYKKTTVNGMLQRITLDANIALEIKIRNHLLSRRNNEIKQLMPSNKMFYL